MAPPVDVTEDDTNSEPAGDVGRVRLDALGPAIEAENRPAHPGQKASSAATPNPAAATEPVALPGRLAVSAALAAQNHGGLKAGHAAPVQLSSGPVMPVQLTAASDENTGVIMIPATAEESAALDPASTQEAAGEAEAAPIHTPQIAQGFQVWSPPGKVNMKKLARRQKREQRRAQPVRKFGFIELYDADLERLDVDQYERQILLTSGDESVEPAPVASADEDDTMDEDSESTRLFDRSITAIKPTLDFAWGDINPSALPPNFHANEMDKGEYVDRVASRTVLQWEPSNLWYHPVYFEDIGLERYGHSVHPWFQPFVSSGRFFGQVATLPYQMALRPASSREFALGYYQPGEWAPKKKYQLPFNEEAAAAEFLWITAIVLLIP